MKTINLIVGTEHDQKTVHHMVLKVMKLSSGAYSRLKFTGGITLDGKQAYARDKVRAGQLLQVIFPDGSCHYPQTNVNTGNICIAYEDEDYYVIEKPAGLATMHSPAQGGTTVETGLYSLLGKPEHYVFRPVNRLDKGTGGLMAVAKYAHAQQLLQKQLHTDQFVREYTALCKGFPLRREGVINAPIGKMEEGIKRCITADGKPALTEYKVIECGEKGFIAGLRLHTGRTHQIRVHMAYLGCPVWGDYLYGEEDEHFPGCFALHSSHILFTQPISGERIELVSKVPKMWYDILRR